MPAKNETSKLNQIHRYMPKFRRKLDQPRSQEHAFQLPAASYTSGPDEFPIEKIILDPVQHMDVIGGPYQHLRSLVDHVQTFKESPEPTTLAGGKYEDTGFRVYYNSVSEFACPSEESLKEPAEPISTETAALTAAPSISSGIHKVSVTSPVALRSPLELDCERHKIRNVAKYIAKLHEPEHELARIRDSYPLLDTVLEGCYRIQR